MAGDEMLEKGQEMQILKPETPHFFKIILPETLQSGKLGIPSRFVRKYRKHLSDVLCLKVPSGRTWQVDLEWSDEHEDMAWLSRGWDDFMDYYSIDSGYFLVFGYTGYSTFRVIIFDPSATEIDYPQKSINCKRPHVDHDGSYEGTLQVALPSPKTKSEVQSSSECSMEKPPKTLKPNISIEAANESKRWETIYSGKTIAMSEKRKIRSCTAARAIEAASKFKSHYGFFHIVFAAKHMEHYVTVPPMFLINHLTEKRTQTVTLTFLKRSWRVKLLYNAKNGHQCGKLSSGWLVFRRQLPLVDGDVCIFELVNEKDMVFNVSIFRGDVLFR